MPLAAIHLTTAVISLGAGAVEVGHARWRGWLVDLAIGPGTFVIRF
jgi:hypothetical protein